MKAKERWEQVSLVDLFVKKTRGQATEDEVRAVDEAMADRRPGGFKKIYKTGDRLVVR